jgi:hypothetical protein
MYYKTFLPQNVFKFFFLFQGLPELDVTIESLEILEGKNMCATLVYQRLIRRGYMTEEGGLVF